MFETPGDEPVPTSWVYGSFDKDSRLRQHSSEKKAPHEGSPLTKALEKEAVSVFGNPNDKKLLKEEYFRALEVDHQIHKLDNQGRVVVGDPSTNALKPVNLNESSLLEDQILKGSPQKMENVNFAKTLNDGEIEISEETLYAIDKVVRKRVRNEQVMFDESLLQNTTSQNDNSIKLTDLQGNPLNQTTPGANKMTFEEWFLRKETEKKLKSKLIENVKAEI